MERFGLVSPYGLEIQGPASQPASQPATFSSPSTKQAFSKLHRPNNITKMDVNSLLAYVPKPALAAFAAIGLITVSRKVISYVQLLLSLFVLPGANVCDYPHSPPNSHSQLSCSSANMVKKAPGQSSLVHLTA